MLPLARLFHNSVHWSQNDAWLLELRERLGREIVALREALGERQPE